MRIDEMHLLHALTLLSGRGHDVAALDLHLAALIGARDGDLVGELARAWELSERLFLMVHAPEASQLTTWRACVSEVLGTQENRAT